MYLFVFHFVKIAIVVTVAAASFMGNLLSCFLSTETPRGKRLKLNEEVASWMLGKLGTMTYFDIH